MTPLPPGWPPSPRTPSLNKLKGPHHSLQPPPPPSSRHRCRPRRRPPRQMPATRASSRVGEPRRGISTVRVPGYRASAGLPPPGSAAQTLRGTAYSNPCVKRLKVKPYSRGQCAFDHRSKDSRAATHEPRLTRAKAESSSISLSVAFLAHLRPCSSCTNYNQQIFCIVVCEC